MPQAVGDVKEARDFLRIEMTPNVRVVAKKRLKVAAGERVALDPPIRLVPRYALFD